MSSEIAMLRERLRLEMEGAYQGLHGYALVTQHRIIHQRMLQIDQTFRQLVPYIGEEAAELILVNGLDVAYQKEQQDVYQRKKQQNTRDRRDQ